ncbi:hypothetical protein [Mongoliimonas terrestris]|uniref:hypothetical protein n=1 Tax=Mongoliimonas terrestris TaxID=1709001 RepID=UPI000949AF03|nr:hypothetical protein [Mongoliimonas terrestris]
MHTALITVSELTDVLAGLSQMTQLRSNGFWITTGTHDTFGAVVATLGFTGTTACLVSAKPFRPPLPDSITRLLQTQRDALEGDSH